MEESGIYLISRPFHRNDFRLPSYSG